MSNLSDQIARIISEVAKLRVSEFGPSENLIVKFGVDSMQRIEILIAIEKQLEVEIPDEKAKELRTLNDFVRAVEQHMVPSK